MAKGFTDEKGRFRPIGNQSPVSRKEKTIDAGKGTLITEGTFEFTPRERGVTWDKAVDRFVKFRDSNNDLIGFSFDPVINEGFDFEDPDQVIDFHELNVEGGEENPVFVIGVTNQLGGTPTRELQSAYEDVKNKGRTPLIGFFIDDNNNEFTDIAFPVSGVSREEALLIGGENAQDSISVLFSDGTFSIEDVR